MASGTCPKCGKHAPVLYKCEKCGQVQGNCCGASACKTCNGKVNPL